jgi:hypothetical protein
MTRQGRCMLEADESGRIVDKLAGLEQVIKPAIMRQVLEETGRTNVRACKLTHNVMLWVVLAMGILTNLPIRQVFRYARRLRVGEETPERSSLCVARQRLGIEPVMQLFDRMVRPLATPGTAGAFWRGLHLFAMDGTVMNLPDTPRNAAYFGRPSGGDRGEGAFPQLRKVSLVEVGTHVEVAFKVVPYWCGEEAAVPTLLTHVLPNALVMWDRNFFSYKLWKTLISRGIHVLARIQKGPLLKPIRRLSDGSYLAKIYPKAYDRQKDRNGIIVRVIKYTLDDPQRVGCGEEHTLMTDLLDEELYPAGEFIFGYHERWEHEMTFDEQKVHQDPPRVNKPAHLRSESPEGVVQELYALSLAHFVIRSLMFTAAQRAEVDVDRLSFTGCYHILRCRLPEYDGRNLKSFAEWCEALLSEMSREQIPERRNRINPRVIKRKIAKWPKKRPEHRHPPPLTKTFTQSVVMLN